MPHKLNSAIAVIGIDIGKNSFHVVGHDKRGAIMLRQKWSRGPGVGSGNRLSSSLRSPRNTTPFMVLLRCAMFGMPV